MNLLQSVTAAANAETVKPTTVSMTTGNETKAKAKAMATPSALIFTRQNVFDVIGRVPTSGVDAVLCLALFCQKVGLLDKTTGKKGTVKGLLADFKRAYDNPGQTTQGEIAANVSSGVQNPVFKAFWDYCMGFTQTKIQTKGRGASGGNSLAAMIQASIAAMDTEPATDTELATDTEPQPEPSLADLLS